MAQTDPTTVISAFVSNLAGSTVWVGGLSNGLTAAGGLPQHARQVWTRDSQIG
jgi:hypothetical protein